MKTWLLLLLLSISFYHPAAFAVVYGEDNRREAPKNEISRAVGMLLTSNIEHVEDYPEPIATKLGLSFLTSTKVEPNDERQFIDQPRVGDCTSFLVSDDLMFTAGHCIQTKAECAHTQVVFDYFAPEKKVPRLVVPKKDIYRCQELVLQHFTPSDSYPDDYAVFRLNRKVKDRAPLKLSLLPMAQLIKRSVFLMGFPRGVYMKFTDDAEVLRTESPSSFRTNLDAFQVNSGSPIFDQLTGEVIGITIRGSRDDAYAGMKQIDASYPQYPDPTSKQWSSNDLNLAEQGFYIGAVLRKLAEANVAIQ